MNRRTKVVKLIKNNPKEPSMKPVIAFICLSAITCLSIAGPNVCPTLKDGKLPADQQVYWTLYGVHYGAPSTFHSAALKVGTKSNTQGTLICNYADSQGIVSYRSLNDQVNLPNPISGKWAKSFNLGYNCISSTPSDCPFIWP